MKFVIFALLVIAAMAMAAPQGQQEATCSPVGGLCYTYSDCCRFTSCLTYMSKCVSQSGLIIPGRDTRPLGPGPYPPNVPNEYLENPW